MELGHVGLIGRHDPLGRSGIRQDGCQRLIQLVRQRPGQLTQSGHPAQVGELTLLLLQLQLGPLPFSDIANEGNGSRARPGFSPVRS